jgi:serine phosphatase RsbU (regulator of sigma subunit)
MEALTLIRIDGPDDPLVGDRVVIDADGTIGRAVGCAVCLPAPSVSRRHAAARWTAQGWAIADEGSTSGTLLNGRRLEAEPALLRTGDVLTIGPWTFRVGEGTATRTVGLTIDGPGTAATPSPSRRLDALSACLDAMERARGPEELAAAALRAAMDGTGFGRAAVLAPPAGGAAGMLAGLARTHAGVTALDPGGFAPSRSLIEQAAAGRAAVHASGRGPGEGPAPAHSIAEQAIHSAVCVPVLEERRVTALLYLDARRGESAVDDAAGFCADVARLYAFALAREARAELGRRQESLRVELERARELRAMLAPEPAGWAGRYRHASRTIAGLFVSADLFDAVGHDDGSATVLFGDASGHGVGAAMLAALVHSHLASAIGAGAALADAVGAANRFIASRRTGGRFVSLLAARLGPDGSGEVVDAGHGQWLIARRGGAGSGVEHAGRAGGFPLGVDPAARFPARAIRLGPGDRLVCYTDGIPDQVGADGERFGIDRVRAAVGSSADCEADVARLFDALLRHAGGGAPGGRGLDDDATVASVGFGG